MSSSNALSALSSAYDSDSSEDEELKEEVTLKILNLNPKALTSQDSDKVSTNQISSKSYESVEIEYNSIVSESCKDSKAKEIEKDSKECQDLKMDTLEDDKTNVLTVPFIESETKEALKDFLDIKPINLDFSSIKPLEDSSIVGEVPLHQGEPFALAQIKQEPLSDTSDSDSDSELSSSSMSDSDSDETKERKERKKEPPRVKGELSFKDLPLIEDLHISVPHEQTKPIGVIKSFVDPLVIVEAYLNTPALDLDSVLFLDQGDRALGHVFDVIGPVKQPLYCVRFNSLDHIEKQGLTKGMPVYCAPSTPHSTFVFLAQLEKLKGTDASWTNDHEAPLEELVSSGDESTQTTEGVGKNKARKIAKARRQAQAESHEGHVLPGGFQPPQVPGFYHIHGPRPRPQYRGRGRGTPNHYRPRGRGGPSLAPQQPLGQVQQNNWNNPYTYYNQMPFDNGGYQYQSYQYQQQPPPPPPPPQYSNPNPPSHPQLAFPYPHPYVQNPTWRPTSEPQRQPDPPGQS